MNSLKYYFLIFILSGCSLPTRDNITDKNLIVNDSLELELIMLKNQAFCSCFNRTIKKAGTKMAPSDGSNYLQLSNLVVEYTFDPILNKLIEKWVNKKYTSYCKDDELYLMRCLDFYNSKELNTYIDSVRQVEIKKLTIDFK